MADQERARPRIARSDAFGAAAVAALVAQASGGVTAAQAASTAAVEAAAGLLGRAFGAADVAGPEPIKRALTPATLEMIGRQIIRTGDHLVRIRVDGGRIVLDPVGDWDVRGSYAPETWTYRAHFGGPSRTTTARGLTRDEVLALSVCGRTPAPMGRAGAVAIRHAHRPTVGRGGGGAWR